MIIAIVILSTLFIGIAFIVTESNAKYLLSGYNTMSEKERAHFDIKSFVPYFRKFHLVLGSLLFVFSLLIYFQINSDWAMLFLGVFPIISYVYFIWKSNQFYFEKTKKQNISSYIAMIVMASICVVVLYEFQKGLKNNEVIMHPTKIEITGEYGAELDLKTIKSINLVDSLPEISNKLNGFALETIKKGYFKTATQEKVVLLINSTKTPLILITKTNGEKIYYSSKDKSNKPIFDALIKTYFKELH
ncbi:MAG: hypothetical protein RLZZ231_144 [Bacteroidota bacterium]